MTVAAQAPARALVSLVPALTDMVVAMGGRPQLVGGEQLRRSRRR